MRCRAGLGQPGLPTLPVCPSAVTDRLLLDAFELFVWGDPEGRRRLNHPTEAEQRQENGAHVLGGDQHVQGPAHMLVAETNMCGLLATTSAAGAHVLVAEPNMCGLLATNMCSRGAHIGR